MWEKSPFTFSDFIKQRKRWLQGVSLVVYERSLPWYVRFYLGKSSVFYAMYLLASVKINNHISGIGFYSSVTMPLALLNIVLVPLYPVPLYWPLKFIIGVIGGASSYLYVIGTFRSFSLGRLGFTRFTIRVIGAVATMPVAIMCEAIAIVWGLFGNNREFYIINKAIDVQSWNVI
jgi:egghead protein (zeste-white 4 protein)